MGVTLGELEAYLDQFLVVAKDYELQASAFHNKSVFVEVQSWNGSSVDTTIKELRYDYHSATLRTAWDVIEDTTEFETIIPRYIPEETLIKVVKSDAVELTVDGNAVELLEDTVRAWMRTTAT